MACPNGGEITLRKPQHPWCLGDCHGKSEVPGDSEKTGIIRRTSEENPQEASRPGTRAGGQEARLPRRRHHGLRVGCRARAAATPGPHDAPAGPTRNTKTLCPGCGRATRRGRRAPRPARPGLLRPQPRRHGPRLRIPCRGPGATATGKRGKSSKGRRKWRRPCDRQPPPPQGGRAPPGAVYPPPLARGPDLQLASVSLQHAAPAVTLKCRPPLTTPLWPQWHPE